MIRHLIKLIWNKKGTHSLLIIEILASFLVLFGLSTLLISNVSKYLEPLGFTYENVWAISLANNQDTTEVSQKAQAIFQRLKRYPEVESVSRMSDNTPFSNYHNSMGISYNKTVTQVEFYVADQNLAETLAIPLVMGSWYRGSDSVAKYRPVVINQKASESLFGNANPIGKIIKDYEDKKGLWRVSGVIGLFKGRGEFAKNEPVMVELLDEKSTWNKSMLIRVKPGTDAVFEAKMVHDITTMAKGWSVEASYLVDSRKTQQNITLVPIIIFLIISTFLLINVALGLFGVLNLSIAKRRGEIGLRRALGATGGGISTQFIGEIWVLATFAMLIGLLFAIQFPLLNVFDMQSGIYVSAIGLSILIIYVLVTLCALFPSRQAATIQPATALHEE